MRISWNKGISISYNGLNLILDAQGKIEESIHTLISHAHYDHSKAFKISGLKKYSTKETREIAALYGIGHSSTNSRMLISITDHSLE